MSYSDLTLVVTSGVLLKGSNEGLLWFCSCNLREVGTSNMSYRRGIWVLTFDSHFFSPFKFVLTLLNAYIRDIQSAKDSEEAGRHACM